MARIDLTRRRRARGGRAGFAASVLAVGAAVLLSACGGSSPSSSTPTTSTGSSGGALITNPSQWLQVDPTSKTATLVLDASHGGANNGFNFDGFANGHMVVTVPTGWKVTVECKNESTAVPHSCAIVKSAGATTPAFPGAEAPNPTTGLSPGQSASFTFTAGAVGTYRIDCLVPGHDPAGMWNSFDVVGSGTPSVTATGGTSSGGPTNY